MSLVLSLLLKASGKQATAEVRGLREEITRTTNETRKLTPQVKQAEAATTGMQRRFNGVTASLGRVRASFSAYIAGLRGLDAANQNSARHVSNITAQFNDIGVMLAAGQNPIQLALQQGTQLTQVFSQLGGGAAALRSVGAALVSMVNPISLITIGSIAAGAAMTRWLTGAAEEAETLDDRLQSIADRLDQVTKLSSTSARELLDAFGASDGDVLALYAAQLRASEDNLLREARTLGAGMAAELEEGLGEGLLRSAQTDLLSLLGLSPDRLYARTGGGAVGQEIARVKALLSDLGSGDDIEGDIALVAQLRARVDEAATAAGSYSDQQAQWRDTLLEVEAALRKALAVQTAAGREGLKTAKDIGQALWDNVAGRLEEAAAAGEFIDQQTRRAELERTIALYGADSYEVARLKAEQDAAAARSIIEATTSSKVMRDAMWESYRNAQSIADAGMASEIGNAASEAARLHEELGLSLEMAMRISSFGPQGLTPSPPAGGRGADPRTLGGSFLDWQTRDAANFKYVPPKKGSGGAGSAAIDKERQAVENLIARYRTELEVLRETDPVRQEMIRNREAMAAATAEERQTITDLIIARDAENRSIEQQRDLMGLLEQASDSVFNAIAQGADGGKAALESLLVTLAKVTAQALLLGEGPLAGYFGPNAGGGATGDAAGTAPAPAFAAGGLLRGPGSGTSDSMLIRASNGEFVINAAATRRHLPLLKALNAGGLPAFARGGYVGSSPPRLDGAIGTPARDLVIIENRSSTPITAERREEQDLTGRRKTTLVLSDQVAQALTLPGGGSKRTLQNVYNVKPRGTRR